MCSIGVGYLLATLFITIMMSYPLWKHPVESVSSLIIMLAGLILIGFFIDWLRKKIGKYPM